MIIQGVVASGLGRGARATQLPWFRSVVEDRYGFSPVPGTFNLTGVHAISELNALLLQAAMVLVPPGPEYCCAMLMPVLVLPNADPGNARSTGRAAASVSAVLVRPLVLHYPRDQVELVSAFHLRSLLGVRDGDVVVVEVPTPREAGGWVQAREDPAASGGNARPP